MIPYHIYIYLNVPTKKFIVYITFSHIIITLIVFNLFLYLNVQPFEVESEHLSILLCVHTIRSQ